ncbi:HNH endonuclease [Yersinia enterocolitica]|uniref:HNH endonuclease n=1 Tax=Yersinia enterocolitica TaxID=630 RepID=UPI003F441AA0
MKSDTSARQFFWVNHNKLYKTERSGGFLRCPYTNKDGSNNQTYTNIRDVKLGDIIFSFAKQEIGALGVATSTSYQVVRSPDLNGFEKPLQKVNVGFSYPLTPFKPKDKIKEISPLLENKYSPIRTDGGGNQKFYLTKLSEELGMLLLKLSESKNILKISDKISMSVRESQLAESLGVDDIYQDVQEVLDSNNIPETTKKLLVDARVGQGGFRKKLIELYPKCPVTGIGMPEMIRASHIKPWRESSDKERLDRYNGLMLAAHVDVLFDKGFISFSDQGEMLIGDEPLISEIIEELNIKTDIKIKINNRSMKYLKWHRDNLFNKSK